MIKVLYFRYGFIVRFGKFFLWMITTFSTSFYGWSPLFLPLSMDGHHFFYLFLWMITTLSTFFYGWSPLFLHLSMDDHHFFYLFLWMITTLSTSFYGWSPIWLQTKLLLKKTLIIRHKNGDITRLVENEWGVPYNKGMSSIGRKRVKVKRGRSSSGGV
jgi:hypothetical protein